MKMLKCVGGSLSALYLVCVLFAVGAMGLAPSVLVPHANADTGENISGAAVLLAANNIQVKAESVAVVAEASSDESVGFIAWVLANVPDLLLVLSSLVGTASLIASLTPTPKDDGVLLIVRKILDFVALNVLGAKNARSSKDSNRLT